MEPVARTQYLTVRDVAYRTRFAHRFMFYDAIVLDSHYYLRRKGPPPFNTRCHIPLCQGLIIFNCFHPSF